MNKESDDTKMISQNKAIKERLINYYDSLKESQGLTYAQVREQLAKATDGFDVSYTAVHDLLTYNKKKPDKAPNMCVVLGLCRLWHLDYALVLAPPKQKVTLQPSEIALENKVSVLTDPKYHGTYYGYKYTRNRTRDEIASFELTLKEQGNSVEARMITHSRPSYVGGEEGEFSNIYIGTPYLVQKSGTVSMFLVNEEGDFCSLTYDYEPYSFDKLYFRKGIVVTAESNNKKPYMMNFLLFQKPVSEEKQREYFPGMLKLTDNYFFVPKNEVESLLEDEQFAKLMKKYCGYLEDKERSLYLFKVKQILANVENELDADEINEVMQFLFKLQGKAMAPSTLEYSNPDGLPSFAKNYLQVDSE